MKFNHFLAAFAFIAMSLPFLANAQDTASTLRVSGIITGSGTVSVGSTSALVDTNTGGRWSSSDNAVATISRHGIVTGMTSGEATISYTYADASFALVVDIVKVTVSPVLIGEKSGDKKILNTLPTGSEAAGFKFARQ